MLNLFEGDASLKNSNAVVAGRLEFDRLLGAGGLGEGGADLLGLLLEGGAEFFGLLLEGGELALGEFGLERQDFLHVLGLHQLRGEVKSRLDIGLGVAERGRTDYLGAGGGGNSRGVDGGDGLLRGAEKPSKALRACSTLFSANSRTSVGI